MADESALVPVWTLATEAVAVPGLVSDGDMTPRTACRPAHGARNLRPGTHRDAGDAPDRAAP